MQKTAAAFCVAYTLLFVPNAHAENVKVHKLHIAASRELRFTNAEADRIISAMNNIVRKSDYSWDVACTKIRFERDGDVFSDISIQGGSISAVVNQVRPKFPKVNMVIVSSMICGSVSGAIGCGNIGSEPAMMLPNQGDDGQVWAHERGHNVGLHHSAENGDPKGSEEDVYDRVMYWQAGTRHWGLTQPECDAYYNSRLGSVVTEAAESAAGAEASTSTDSPPPESDFGLTPAALDAVKSVMDSYPIDKIKALNETDLASLRKMLDGDANMYTARAMYILAYRGVVNDIEIIGKPLSTEMPELPENPDQKSIVQMRFSLQAKLAAPGAIGVLGNVTKDQKAAEILQHYAALENAEKVAGKDSARAISVAALEGLVTMHTPEALAFVKANLTQTNNVEQAEVGPGGIPKLTTDEINALTLKSDNITKLGVDAVLKGADK